MEPIPGSTLAEKRMMRAATFAAPLVLFSTATLAGGPVPPPPPPPAGAISFSADGYGIAPATVSFNDAGSVFSLSSIGWFDWNFGTTDGQVVGVASNYQGQDYGNTGHFQLNQPCYGRVANCGDPNWYTYYRDYGTTNPWAVGFRYNHPGTYTVTLMIAANGTVYSTTATVVIAAPPAPSGFTKTGGGATYLNFSWNAVPGVDGYNIQIQNVAGCLFSYFDGLTLVIGQKSWYGYTGTTGTVNDAMICLGSQYHAQIQSYKGDNKGPWSDWTPNFQP